MRRPRAICSSARASPDDESSQLALPMAIVRSLGASLSLSLRRLPAGRAFPGAAAGSATSGLQKAQTRGGGAKSRTAPTRSLSVSKESQSCLRSSRVNLAGCAGLTIRKPPACGYHSKSSLRLRGAGGAASVELEKGLCNAEFAVSVAFVVSSSSSLHLAANDGIGGGGGVSRRLGKLARPRGL